MDRGGTAVATGASPGEGIGPAGPGPARHAPAIIPLAVEAVEFTHAHVPRPAPAG
jgi:hypothetical protein